MPTKIGDTYHCSVCGNKVKVIQSGGGTLVCCGIEMELVEQ
jgi:desulfoferrodoxin-like iron-binding protein